MTSFAELGVPDDLVRTLQAKAIDAPFPIQALTLVDALAGRDVSGKAPTGSGKTLAFGIPMVAGAAPAGPKRPTCLVLVPTRELASQVARELIWLGKRRKVRVLAVYGGAGFGPQLTALRRGVEIVVACPGRLEDLMARGEADLSCVRTVVIDEADRMADMGFLPTVRRILDQTPTDRQTLLFSATLDGAVDALVRDYQRDPVRHERPEDPETPSLATHLFWMASRDDRIDIAARIVRAAGPTFVFCRTKHGSDNVAKKLGRTGLRIETIHGNRSQAQRERALKAFTEGKVDALVATDVAARGIHVDDVACVVHYDPPADEKDYTHRSGRTARAGAAGTVISLVMPDQAKGVRRMQRTLGLPDGIGAPSDAAFDALGAVMPPPRPPVPAKPSKPAKQITHPKHGKPGARSGRARTRGTLKFYDIKRGFGFIDQGTGEDLFVHHSGLDVAGHRLKEGQVVEYEVVEGRKGEEARELRIPGD